jgi:hypothetical protein
MASAAFAAGASVMALGTGWPYGLPPGAPRVRRVYGLVVWIDLPNNSSTIGVAARAAPSASIG